MNTRKILFEFEDLPWFPAMLRESMTDYLRYILTLTNFYEPVTALLTESLQQTGSNTMVDLCSGGGGPINQVKNNLEMAGTGGIKIILTDKFPNTTAFEFLAAKSTGTISYIQHPVDAMNVSPDIKGFRTMFSAFHHFSREQATAILKNATTANTGIAIFDGGSKNMFTVLLIIIVHPLAFFFLTPFFRPFKWSRIIFTYIIPLIPLFTIWDGIVSITRLYMPAKLMAMAMAVEPANYHWQSGFRKNKWGLKIAFLIGIPKTGKTDVKGL